MLVTWATVVSMLLIQVQYGAIEDFKERRWAMICLSNDDTDCYRVSKLNMNRTLRYQGYIPLQLKVKRFKSQICTHTSHSLCVWGSTMLVCVGY